MKNDSLQKWALVAEIIGGIAIVLSLAFVGFQIRQGSEQTELNTRAVEVSAYQDLIAQMNIMYLKLIDDDELLEIVTQLARNELNLDERQAAKLAMYVGYVFRHSEMAFVQFDKGLITEEQLFVTTSPLRDVLNTDLGYERWLALQFTANFVEYMESQRAAGWPQIF